MFFFNLSRP